MAIYTFGAGALWGVRTDVSNATPIKFGTLQSVSVDFDATTKELYGSKQFPVAVARGKAKITGKAKIGVISGLLFSNLFFNETPVTGQQIAVDGEAATVPASTPYTVTVANAGASGVNYISDLGVVYASTGLPLTLVASNPTQGQYSEAAGTYTFAAADEGVAVQISYVYQSTTTGQKFVMVNQDLGVQPVFAATFQEKYNGPSGLVRATLRLNACISSKLALASKQEDFEMPEFDFSAFQDSAGNIFTWSFSDNS